MAKKKSKKEKGKEVTFPTFKNLKALMKEQSRGRLPKMDLYVNMGVAYFETKLSKRLTEERGNEVHTYLTVDLDDLLPQLLKAAGVKAKLVHD